MAYRYHSRRSVKRLSSKSKRNFFITLAVVSLLLYSTTTWVLPFFINSVGVVKNTIKPSKKVVIQPPENSSLAPPVLNIPYEATSTTKIDIKGYSTPGSKVKLFLDDEFVKQTNVSSDGSFIFDSILLNLGTNNIYGKTVDDQNNESLASKTIKLIYDYEKPSLTVSEPEDGKLVQGGDKKIKVLGKTDPNINVFINGAQTIVGKEGNFSTEQLLNDGENTISIQAIDAALNTTEIQRRVTYNP